MQRRQALRLLGAIPVIGALTPDDLLAAAEQLRSRNGFSPPFGALSKDEARTVATIADLIIPATDTPGASGAGVPQFIDLIVGEWYTESERAAFHAGVREVDARSRYMHGGAFVDLTATQQTSVLRAMEAEAIVLHDSGATPPPFFATMKQLTLWGYYTSEVGMTKELGFELIPGQFNGSLPLPPRR